MKRTSVLAALAVLALTGCAAEVEEPVRGKPGAIGGGRGPSAAPSATPSAQASAAPSAQASAAPLVEETPSSTTPPEGVEEGLLAGLSRSGGSGSCPLVQTGALVLETVPATEDALGPDNPAGATSYLGGSSDVTCNWGEAEETTEDGKRIPLVVVLAHTGNQLNAHREVHEVLVEEELEEVTIEISAAPEAVEQVRAVTEELVARVVTDLRG